MKTEKETDRTKTEKKMKSAKKKLKTTCARND